MLINFYLENYLSYKNFAHFTMQANKKHERKIKEDKPENIFEVDEKYFGKNESNRLVKSSVIYGANASGKTNLIRAMIWLKKFITESESNNENIPLNLLPCFFSDKEDYTNIGIEIIAGDGEKYRYIVFADNKMIYSEVLEIFRNGGYKKIFTRERDGEIIEKDGTKVPKYEFSYGTGIKTSEKKKLKNAEAICSFNKSFLSCSNRSEVEFSKYIWRWFSKKFYAFENKSIAFGDSYVHFKNNDSRILNILSKLGLGDVKPTYNKLKKDANNNFLIQTTKEPKTIVFHEGEMASFEGFKHKGIPIKEKYDSSGLFAIYAFIGTLINLFDRGLTVVIDELDRHLHPDLIAMVIKMVNNSKINPKNGQLIFTTHSDSILDNDIDLFRSDQVWFIEKPSYEEGSELFSYNDIKKYEDKRRDKRKVYRAGRIGARPYIRESLLKFIDGAGNE